MDIFLSGLFVILVIAVIAGVTVWPFWACTSYDTSITHRALSVVTCLVAWSMFFGSMLKHEQENPCVKYEETMQYNAATKTMMSMRVCVERGEWVED